jgi:hypothetical protein
MIRQYGEFQYSRLTYEVYSRNYRRLLNQERLIRDVKTK